MASDLATCLVQASNKFQLMVNLKGCKQRSGVDVRRTPLARADEVIEVGSLSFVAMR